MLYDLLLAFSIPHDFVGELARQFANGLLWAFAWKLLSQLTLLEAGLLALAVFAIGWFMARDRGRW